VFLASVLVIGRVADAAGLFDWAGDQLARTRGSSTRLLVLVAVTAVAVTSMLSLDATAVLLTPVVVRMARRRELAAAPFALVTAQLANGGSLLLPVANLTNLLVWSATGLSFAGFAVRMAIPGFVASAVITVGVARLRRRDLAVTTTAPAGDARSLERFGLLVAATIALLLVSFAIGSAAGLDVAWLAAAGALVLAALTIGTGRAVAPDLLRATAPELLALVAGLAVLVAALDAHGVAGRLGDFVPAGHGFLALLGVALVAALLANVVNNLPATLVLVAAVGHAPATLLAVLLGVNIGPNLTPTGSLATLLWRRAVRAEGADVGMKDFLRVGAVLTPVALILATAGLWMSLTVWST
jgi:arsenical pump membrane protein